MDHNDTPLNIFLDLSKAFDTLDHEILLAKLQYNGTHGTPLELVKSYLTNRKQYVEIEDTKSKMLDISTGVPQGSILGPLLFIIYDVNDFALSSEKFKFVMYTDDATLTSTLETFSTNDLNGNTASSINIELNKISECLKLNRLSLNVQKTTYMLFRTSKKKVQTLLLQMDNEIIVKVLDFNFLGIHFNEQLNWKSHIDKVSVKCSRILTLPKCRLLCEVDYESMSSFPLLRCSSLVGNVSFRWYLLCQLSGYLLVGHGIFCFLYFLLLVVFVMCYVSLDVLYIVVSSS